MTNREYMVNRYRDFIGRGLYTLEEAVSSLEAVTRETWGYTSEEIEDIILGKTNRLEK